VTHIRSKGAMNCIISTEILDAEVLKNKLAEVPDMSGLELASIVSTDKPYELGDPTSMIRVSVMDYGIKRNILNCMVVVVRM
jgi:carbamoyl-phosphate synthase small subunit